MIRSSGTDLFDGMEMKISSEKSFSILQEMDSGRAPFGEGTRPDSWLVDSGVLWSRGRGEAKAIHCR